MKIKTLIQIICISSCMAVFSACNDEDGYPPITLSYAENGQSPIHENALTVNTFDEDGVPFRIFGGDNGRYVIHNSNPQIVNCNYNGDILSIVPLTIGNATIKITDYSGNSYTLQVTVAYPTQTYTISEIQADVTGEDLTGKQIETIKADILSRIPVQVEGSYVFTFRNKEQTYGTVEIYPSKYSKPLGGNFKYTQAEGYEYTLIEINLSDDTSYHYTLKPYSSSQLETGEQMSLQEDVTDTYKGLYPALEKAFSYQIFPNPSAR